MVGKKEKIMKMKHAWDIIEGRTHAGIIREGFMVSFDWIRDIFLHSDHFPDKHAGEKLIETEEEAWELAYGFANKTLGQAVNICVVDATFSPVLGYREKIINSTRSKNEQRSTEK